MRVCIVILQSGLLFDRGNLLPRFLGLLCCCCCSSSSSCSGQLWKMSLIYNKLDQNGTNWTNWLKLDHIGSNWHGLDKHGLEKHELEKHGLEMVLIWFWNNLPAVLDLTLMPYPCSNFYFDIKFGLFSFEYNLSPNLISK